MPHRIGFDHLTTLDPHRSRTLADHRHHNAGADSYQGTGLGSPVPLGRLEEGEVGGEAEGGAHVGVSGALGFGGRGPAAGGGGVVKHEVASEAEEGEEELVQHPGVFLGFRRDREEREREGARRGVEWGERAGTAGFRWFFNGF